MATLYQNDILAASATSWQISDLAPAGQEPPLDVLPGSSHSAWSSMRAEIFFMQGLREILVGAITSQLAELMGKKEICLACVPSYAASRLRNSARLLPIYSLGPTMKPVYDSRSVPAHDDKIGASVFLMNEAPGPSEATSGIPSFGQQGANIFHALRGAGISWAVAHQKFVWPRNGAAQQSERHRQKAEFLTTRARYITCTNSFPQWPKPNIGRENFCPPLEKDVVAPENIARIRSELHSTHRAILICGAYAYIACIGKRLLYPSTREATELTSAEIEELNRRLQSNFEKGWYMGHTHRWSTRKQKMSSALRLLAEFSGWSLDTVITP